MEIYPADPIEHGNDRYSGKEIIDYAKDQARNMSQTVIGLQRDCIYNAKEIENKWSEKKIGEVFTSYLVYRFGKAKVFSGRQLAIMDGGWDAETINGINDKRMLNT